MNFKHIVGTWMLALTSTVFTPGANATGEFPTRPVRLISPFPSGSGPDTVMRQVAEKLQHKWGQAVIVEGKPGAAGAIAINELKRGAKDGHDLVLIDGAAVALAPHLYSKLSYDPGKDFDLITPMFKTAFFVLVPATSPYKTLRELVSAAQAHPGKLNYGSWGMGSFGHVGAAMLENRTNSKMVHVVYKDTNQLFLATSTGEIDFSFGSIATVTNFAGKLRALAVAGPSRHAAARDIPTIAEALGLKDFEVSGWTAFAAPKGLPAAVFDSLKRDLDTTMADQDVKHRLRVWGWDNLDLSRSELSAFVATESSKYGEVIRRSKISLD